MLLINIYSVPRKPVLSRGTSRDPTDFLSDLDGTFWLTNI
jgi:hypothetical protein